MRRHLILLVCFSLAFSGRANALFKNTASQKVTVYAYDTSGEVSKTGDAGNITAQISLDGGASVAISDANPTELDATDHPGIYVFDLATTETNCNLLVLTADSSTGDVWIQPISVYTRTVMRGTDGANTTVPDAAGVAPTAVEVRQEMDSNSTQFVEILDDMATSGSLATAQADLDTITGADGVTLATSQGNYAPAKAGDAMTLTAAATSAQLVDDIWDELLTAGTHDITNSAAKRIRQIQVPGYELGAIWVDTENGSAGSVIWENGTAGNPVDNWADALLLSSSTGLLCFRFAGGSSITLTANSDSYKFLGDEYTLNLGGQSISGVFVHGALISGTGTGAVKPVFDHCRLNTTSLPGVMARECGIMGPITVSAADTYFFDRCFSMVAGTSTPSFDFGSGVASSGVGFRNYSGGIEIKNMNQAGTDTMSLEGRGQLVVNANCSGGTVAIRGLFTVTDNASGVVSLSDNARYDIDQTWTGTTRTLTSASGLTIGTVTTVTTTVNNSDMRGTDGASTHAAADIWTVVTRALTDKADFTLASGQLDDVATTASVAAISVQTTRVDGLIEDSGGDRYTAKALEQASGTGASPTQIWAATTRTLTIPTVPVVR